MPRLLLFFSFLLISVVVFSQKYKPADAGSKARFIIKNFGISTGGDISGLKGDISFMPATISASSFNVSVNVNTIDTDNGMRDKDLKGKNYFNAEKYPEIKLVSTKISTTNKTKSGWYFFTGNLTMHGVTKLVSFPFTAVQKGDDYLFTGSFTINRLDFGVGSSSAVLSNPVKVSLSVLAKKS